VCIKSLKFHSFRFYLASVDTDLDQYIDTSVEINILMSFERNYSDITSLKYHHIHSSSLPGGLSLDGLCTHYAALVIIHRSLVTISLLTPAGHETISGRYPLKFDAICYEFIGTDLTWNKKVKP